MRKKKRQNTNKIVTVVLLAFFCVSMVIGMIGINPGPDNRTNINSENITETIN